MPKARGAMTGTVIAGATIAENGVRIEADAITTTMDGVTGAL
jgi:hypothetical protein